MRQAIERVKAGIEVDQKSNQMFSINPNSNKFVLKYEEYRGCAGVFFHSL